MTEKLAYRVPEAATALAMSERTLWRRIQEKKIEALSDNGRVIITKEALQAYIASLSPVTNRAQS